MGHRVNPNSFRLNLNRPWFFQWVSYTNENYKYLILNDYFILKMLNNFIKFIYLVSAVALNKRLILFC